MLKRMGFVIGLAASALLATAASATSFTYDFTTTDATALANHTLDYTDTVSGKTVTLDVYGAHMSSGSSTTSSVSYATAETWSGYGMGVLFGSDTTRNGTHQIDNVGSGVDFVILSFSDAVSLDDIARTAYGITNVGSSADASYMAYNGSASAISSVNATAFSALADGTTATGSGVYSKVWLVSAAVNGNDDGFKLSSLGVSLAPSAVPEPASWAMMVVGFGALGGALRRRRPEFGAMFVA